MSSYQAFIEGKTPVDRPTGMREIPRLPSALKPFQTALTKWALRRGRAALFEGTGLGKTLQQLSWARAVADHEDGQVLILTPLAVAEQTVEEAAKFGICGVHYAEGPTRVGGDITITNYERFEKFNIDEFAGIVLDESGIIKSHDGKTRAVLTEACRSTPWRLCCTATPAPNDYAELGQHAEFLGVMTAKEMLSMFFVHDGSIRANDDSAGADGWRLKRHAETEFWRWVASWAAVIRHPRDLGFDDPDYDLPPLNLHQVNVAAEYKPVAGQLFPFMASTLSERIAVRRDTIEDRVTAAVEIVIKDLFGGVLSTPCSQMKPKHGGAPRHANDTQPTPGENQRLKRLPLNPASQKQAELISAPITSQTKRSSGLAQESSATAITPLDGNDTRQTPNIVTPSSDDPGQSLVAPQLRSGAGDSNKNMVSPSSNMMPCSQNRAADALSAAGETAIGQAAGFMSTIATGQELFAGCSAPNVISDLGSSKTTAISLPAPSNIFPTQPEKWIIWCKLNKEQDRLESMLKDKCFSVYGSLPVEEKISRLRRWLAGERPVLLSKPQICGRGLNLQSCKNVIFVGANDSFEEVYQAIRRCWRFGQSRPVECYFVASELEGNIVANLRRKELAFNKMLDAMASHMAGLVQEQVLGAGVRQSAYVPTVPMELPQWMA